MVLTLILDIENSNHSLNFSQQLIYEHAGKELNFYGHRHIIVYIAGE
jgi:hypothetical protein